MLEWKILVKEKFVKVMIYKFKRRKYFCVCVNLKLLINLF